MRKTLTLLLSGVILSATSCNKEIEFIPLAMPTPIEDAKGNFEPFDVKISKDTYLAGEQVRFYFTGETESIDFYSGEIYRQYEHKDSRIVNVFKPFLSFSTLVNPFPLANNFYCLVSNNFTPSATPSYSDISNSTWHSVNFTYPTAGNAWKAAGSVDLSPYVVEGKPLYFAFKYVNSFSNATPPAHLPYFWYVRDISLKNKLPTDQMVEIGNQTTSGFIEIQGNATTKGTYSWGADRFYLLGNKNAPAGTEHWAVSKAFNASPFDIGGDDPLPIKSPGAPKLISYSQVYTKPGTYKAYFVVKQKNPDGTLLTTTKSVDVPVTK